MDAKALNSKRESEIGLTIPRPPSLAGREKSSRSRSLGGAMPVREEIRLSRIESLSG